MCSLVIDTDIVLRKVSSYMWICSGKLRFWTNIVLLERDDIAGGAGIYGLILA